MKVQTTNPINFEHVSDLEQQLGTDDCTKLIHRFSQEIENLINLISITKIEKAGLENLIGKVHQSAGSAAALGIIGIQKQLNIMESIAETGKPDDLWDELTNLTEIWQVAKATFINKGLMEV